MPNLVFHSVWNLSPTLSVGNNILYESSFIEQIGSGRYNGDENVEISEKISAKGLPYVSDTIKQVNDAILQDNILSYRPINLETGYTNSFCAKDTFYNWSLVK